MCNRLDKDHINSMIHRIETAVEDGIKDAQVIVTDPVGTGHHFEIKVIAKEFEGLTLVKQHQMVMNTIKVLLADDLHAVIIKTSIQ